MMKATRYIFLRFLFTFVSIFTLFGALYFLIEYSINIKQFLHSTATFQENFLYFVSCYLMRFDFFTPLSLIFATLFTIISLKKRFELLAFQAGGISLKRLFAPILLSAFFCMLCMMSFFEKGYPSVVQYVDFYQQKILKKGMVAFSTPQARSLLLEDGTSILFTHENTATKRLQNAYIIPSLSEFFYCNEYDPQHQIGYGVRKIQSTPQGISVDATLEDTFNLSGKIPPFFPSSWSKRYNKALSLTELAQKAKETRQNKLRMTYESNLFYKLVISCFPLLFLPITMSRTNFFSRKESVGILFIAIFSLFICVYMGLLSLIILGEEGIIPPIYAFSIALAIMGSISMRTYAKL